MHIVSNIQCDLAYESCLYKYCSENLIEQLLFLLVMCSIYALDNDVLRAASQSIVSLFCNQCDDLSDAHDCNLMCSTFLFNFVSLLSLRLTLLVKSPQDTVVTVYAD